MLNKKEWLEGGDYVHEQPRREDRAKLCERNIKF